MFTILSSERVFPAVYHSHIVLHTIEMLLKNLILLTTLVCYECTFYSSFWAPLFNPRILNYKVDIPFDPESGKKFRDDFQSKHGFRGETLIANLGNGKGPDGYLQNKDLGEVKFSYTYKDADKNSKYNY